MIGLSPRLSVAFFAAVELLILFGSAAPAGVMLLLTGSEPNSHRAYQALLGAATKGRIDRARLLASCRRIVALKARMSTSR